MSRLANDDARVGATRLATGNWQFLVWAPNSRSVSLKVSESNQSISMESLEGGYHRTIVGHLPAGARYHYRLEDGRELPDPASRFQSEGVHGPSQLVDTGAFQWTDQGWKGRPLASSVFYELHVGTYSREGSFDAVIPHLPELVDLGITTVEIMPIAQFPGARNWGYDGAYLFAPQNSYGGPEQLQRLINAAHAHGIAIALDVVYNHLGPEGNYLSAYGPYFTDHYRTPWGQAVNFDGRGSDEVRRFFLDNAKYWLDQYHIDALRLDAVHGIFDFSAHHFLADLKCAAAELSERLGRQMHIIAESDLNDSRPLNHQDHGGYDLDAQWSDDFHHSVHTLLTKESRGYYEDFGGIGPLVSTLEHGWHYRGQYSVHRQRRHGNSPSGIAPARFVVCIQNHDQVGNRAAGERLSALVPFEALKLAAGITLLSPFTPLLFMGEEYGEPAPFQYFTSHGDLDLVEAVRRGRREEFMSFGWQDSLPDPQDAATFARSHLNHSLKSKEPGTTLFAFYKELIRLRGKLGIAAASSHSVRQLGDHQVAVFYLTRCRTVAVVFNFADSGADLDRAALEGNWTALLYSASACWKGPERENPTAIERLRLAPFSCLLLEQKRSPSEVQ